MIEKSPDYIWTIPASTSMKYHNATQCQPGGQLYHILMACEIMNYILGLEYIQNKYPKLKQRDCFRTAICLHDMIKCGWEEDRYTSHDHPILAQKWIEQTKVEHDINDKLKQYIGRLVVSHSGQWIKSNKSSVVLPPVENDEQFLIHLCDYLGSRANLDMIYDDSIKNKIASFQSLPDISEYKLTFGKHSGKTLLEIQQEDSSYIDWMKTQSLKYPVGELIKQL